MWATNLRKRVHPARFSTPTGRYRDCIASEPQSAVHSIAYPPLPLTQSLLSRVLPVFNDRTLSLDVISLHWHRLVSRPHPFTSTNLESERAFSHDRYPPICRNKQGTRITRRVGGTYQNRDRGSVPCRRNLCLMSVLIHRIYAIQYCVLNIWNVLRCSIPVTPVCLHNVLRRIGKPCCLCFPATYSHCHSIRVPSATSLTRPLRTLITLPCLSAGNLSVLLETGEGRRTFTCSEYLLPIVRLWRSYGSRVC
ncbi:hypothetical protein BJV78DRAFT_898445 [Lactifluus subvellereus]|nr:hypothetical protein BJV78DRAFT_898445 [Lactifluus subvellereus]